MADLARKLYSNDFPQLEGNRNANAAGGTAADFEQVVFAIPNYLDFYLPKTVNEGVMGNQKPINTQIRSAVLISESAANTAGNATNNCDFRLNVYRAGVLQGALGYYSLAVATTLGTIVAAANLNARFTVTPASMAGIVPGLLLAVDTAGNLEYVRVLATTATTFTAIFTIAHAAAATVTTALVGRTGTPFVPADATLGTTSATAVGAPGSVTVTPASIYGIHVGDSLLVDTAAQQEVVQVTAVTGTTFTATFAKTHSGTWAIAASATAATGAQLPLGNGSPFELQAGDVVSIQRLSNNVTGIATPALLCQLDLVPSKRRA